MQHRLKIKRELRLGRKTADQGFRRVPKQGYEASLIRNQFYRIVRNARVAKDDLVHVVDQSGEDALYRTGQFVLVDLPPAVRKKIFALADAAS